MRGKEGLAQSRGRLDALDPKSTAPKRRRKRAYDSVYLERVIELRTRHHRIGKKKLAVLLGVSESYAGRTIADLKQRRLLPAHSHVSVSARTGKVIEHIRRKRRKLRRPQGVRVVEVDTVALPMGDDNPYGNAFTTRATVLATEQGAQRNVDFNPAPLLKI